VEELTASEVGVSKDALEPRQCENEKEEPLEHLEIIRASSISAIMGIYK
jgi:hypothetical protein